MELYSRQFDLAKLLISLSNFSSPDIDNNNSSANSISGIVKVYALFVSRGVANDYLAGYNMISENDFIL